MSNAVLITLIICGTLVLLSLISTIGRAAAIKKTTKNIKNLFKEDK